MLAQSPEMEIDVGPQTALLLVASLSSAQAQPLCRRLAELDSLLQGQSGVQSWLDDKTIFIPTMQGPSLQDLGLPSYPSVFFLIPVFSLFLIQEVFQLPSQSHRHDCAHRYPAENTGRSGVEGGFEALGESPLKLSEQCSPKLCGSKMSLSFFFNF